MENIIYFLNENSNIIRLICTIIASGLAIWGIREWKRQIKGKTDYEIARRYLKASLNLRNAISYVRNPFISIGEQEKALKEHGLNNKEHNDKINLAVYSKRWKKVREAWTDLEREIIDAEVSWGVNAVKSSTNLIRLTKVLFNALQVYLSGDQQKIDRKIIYNQGNLDNPDEFSKKITEAINEIKKFLRSHLL